MFDRGNSWLTPGFLRSWEMDDETTGDRKEGPSLHDTLGFLEMRLFLIDSSDYT